MDKYSTMIAANAGVQRFCYAREDNDSTQKHANVNAHSLLQHVLQLKDTMTSVASVNVPTSQRIVLTLGNSLMMRNASAFAQENWFAQEVNDSTHKDAYVNAQTGIQHALLHNSSTSYLANVSAQISQKGVPIPDKYSMINSVNVHVLKSNIAQQINVSTQIPANVSVPLLGLNAQKHSYTTK